MSKKHQTCQSCERESILISRTLGYCKRCILERWNTVQHNILNAHSSSRLEFKLPPTIPTDETGIRCNFCQNKCQISPNVTGYCGVRKNTNGRIAGGLPKAGNLSWYFDPLPTNCVAAWVCPASTDSGYPYFTKTHGPEYQHFSLAVFYQACTFNCLFCQNWHYRTVSMQTAYKTSQDLADSVDKRVTCICFFGGDPSPQLPHAIKAARLARQSADDRILRICWETNGAMSRPFLKMMAKSSIESGGCIKFDLKAWHENLHIAMTSVSNRQTRENFTWLSQFIDQRPDPPFLVASTLLVPGYIDSDEIFLIAKFIADIDQMIPYSLLAFHPDFLMTDLPTTSRLLAENCLEAAHRAGLKRVRVGNIHLLK